MSAAQLPLRDVHLPAAPAGWPPAPGWWLLMAAAALVVLLLCFLYARRKRRQRRWRQLFDGGLDAAEGAAARLAAASTLLRRAARRHEAGVESLQGEAWLQYLDGVQRKDFSQGPGRLLLDGGYRREVDAAAAACTLARARFLQLMERRR